MVLNIDDHLIFKNYIFSSLKNNPNIELLFNATKCNTIEQNIELLDSNIFLDNLQLLLNYLIQNNLKILNWSLKTSCNLFLNNIYDQIIQLFNTYFININEIGTINYHTSFLTNEILNKENQYNNIILNFYYTIYFNNDINLELLNKIDHLEIIINPDYINSCLTQYITLVNYLQKYKILLDINIKTDYCNNWTTDQILQYLQFLEYLLQIEISCNNNIEEICSHIFIKNNSPVSLYYFDKYKSNVLNCSIGNALSINCKNLTLPVCCGLQHQIFTGGQFIIQNNKIIDIKALDGIHGYLNQKLTNHFYQLKCVACEDKYFCPKGCHSLQFDFNVEPYFPVAQICQLENSRINFLIQKLHNLGIFHQIFMIDNLLDNAYKIQLIKLLINKGYNEYGRYIK